jgi:hypothetical protein
MSALSLISTLQADPSRAALALILASAIAWVVGQWLSSRHSAAALASASAPKAPPTQYTRAQVAEHRGEKDLWVVIGKKVSRRMGEDGGPRREPILSCAHSLCLQPDPRAAQHGFALF